MITLFFIIINHNHGFALVDSVMTLVHPSVLCNPAEMPGWSGGSMNLWLEPINPEEFVRNIEHLNTWFLEKHPETPVVLYKFLRQRDVSELIPEFGMPVTRAKATLLGKTTSPHISDDNLNIHWEDSSTPQEIVQAATLVGLLPSALIFKMEKGQSHLFFFIRKYCAKKKLKGTLAL